MSWKQTCIECGSDRLRGTLDGLSLECRDCETTFPAIVGADEYPPDAGAVKLHGPPGTGKTTQLVRRIEELLRAGYSLGDMTVVTYRKEMARDILAKLYERELISAEALRKPWASEARYVGTLHAICNRLVDVDPPDGLEGEKAEFCRERYGIRYFRDSEETEPTAGELMFQCRSWVIENVVEWDLWDKAPMYDQLLETWDHHPPLADFHYEWEDWKAQQGISDFDDMLLEVYEYDVAPKTPIVAADEYHDFTPIQHGIVSGWLDRDETDVRIVDGDPLQVVYSYAGADADFYRNLELPEVLLPQSFRVPASVWKYATRALEYDSDHEAPPIKPKQEAGEIVERDSARLDRDVLTDAGGQRPSDFVDEYGENVMFLTRTRAQARDVARELRDAGVITYGQEGTGSWNHATKRLAIYNCLQRLDGVAQPKATGARAGQQGIGSYGDAPDEGKDPDGVDLYTDELASFLDRVPAEYFDSEKSTKSKAIPKITGKSKRISAAELGEWLTPGFFEIFTQGADSISELLTYDAREVVAKALRRYDEPVAPHELQDRVNVLTIHASKGQEAETVVLYDGITKRVSTSLSRLPSERRNEARLWYVGCTRAAKRLVVARGGWSWTYPYLPDVDDPASSSGSEGGEVRAD